MQTENQRLKEVRKHLNISQLELSKAIGMKQGSYSDVERGRDGLGVSSTIKLQLKEKYRVNIDYIEKGIEPIILPRAGGTEDEFLNLSPNKDYSKIVKYLLENQEDLLKSKLFVDYLYDCNRELEYKKVIEDNEAKRIKAKELLLRKLNKFQEEDK